MQANGYFSVKKWEKALIEQTLDGGKITQEDVIYAYTGDLSGEGTLRYTMYYRTDKTCVFYGLEHINGVLGGQVGGFIVAHEGIVDAAGVVRVVWKIVNGSASGDLAGLAGDGKLVIAGHREQYKIAFNYTQS